jgi:putative addiction module component (TIGR02574 family)
MGEPARDILSAALRLSTSDRAEVAAELLASLDGEADPDVDQAWAAEIERRIERVRSGQAQGRPWAEVRDELRRRRS